MDHHSDDSEKNKAFEKLHAVSTHPDVKKLQDKISEIVGYELDEAERIPFLEFHDFITNPQPNFILEWRSDPKLNKWYRRLTDGILGDVQSTYGCVLYHASNIDRMESSIGYLIEVFDKSLLGNATIGVGNTQRLDFEYHAFIFCYRRTLDYLARSLSSYFRIDCTSFRTMDKSIKTTGYPSVSEALIEEHKKRLPLFDFVVSKGAKKTVRDLLAHYHGISAGSLNIDAHGWQLFQGGEDLEMGHSPVVSLSSSLSRRIDHLRETIAAFLSIFASEARKLEP